MRPLLHFPSEIPTEPLYLRRIYLPPNSGLRQDEVVKVDWCSRALTVAAAETMLREELTRSRAHAVRLETEDGGYIREWTAWHVVRERLGIKQLKLGDKERIAILIPELPPL
ncbi:MAG: hypothetical protein WBF58_24490 [Xanthobacteraceae bacterium]